MKSIDLRHRLAAVLLAMCLVVCCALPAFATSANIVLGRLGSLHVRPIHLRGKQCCPGNIG